MTTTEQARHFLAQLESNWQALVAGKLTGVQHREVNGKVWDAIRAAGAEVEARVQKGVDAGE